MRRAARRLVETRTESFESRHTVEESRRRLDRALDRLSRSDRAFKSAWSGGDGDAAMLTVTFEPSRHTVRFLKMLSIALAFLVTAAIAAWFVANDALAWMATITAVLAFLGFPLVILGMSSQQDARESRVRRAIRNALQDADEKFPPAQRWADE